MSDYGLVEFRMQGKEPLLIKVKEDIPVMKLAEKHNISGIIGRCGGNASCGTCHVYVINAVDNSTLLKRTLVEEEVLASTASAVLESSRLSCQMIVGPSSGRIIVEIASNQ